MSWTLVEFKRSETCTKISPHFLQLCHKRAISLCNSSKLHLILGIFANKEIKCIEKFQQRNHNKKMNEESNIEKLTHKYFLQSIGQFQVFRFFPITFSSQIALKLFMNFVNWVDFVLWMLCIKGIGQNWWIWRSFKSRINVRNSKNALR